MQTSIPLNIEHKGVVWKLWRFPDIAEPLICDRDLATLLGFAEPAQVVALIDAMEKDGLFRGSELVAVRGGQSTLPIEHYLTEGQARLVSMKLCPRQKFWQFMRSMGEVFVEADPMPVSRYEVRTIVREEVRRLFEEAGLLRRR